MQLLVYIENFECSSFICVLAFLSIAVFTEVKGLTSPNNICELHTCRSPNLNLKEEENTSS